MARKPGGSLTGLSPNIGSLSIHTDDEVEREENVQEGTIERVGNYKVVHRVRSQSVEFWPYRNDIIWRRTKPDELTYTHVVQYAEDGEAVVYAHALWEDRLSWKDAMAYLLTHFKALLYKVRLFVLYGTWPQLEVIVSRIHCVGFRVIHSKLPQFPAGCTLLHPDYVKRHLKK